MSDAIVAWSGELETGVEEIDAQHRKLFDLMNSLQAAVAEGREHEVVSAAVFEMSAYADQHFKTEQAYVEDDPSFKDHLLDHWEFSKKCLSLVMGLKNGNSVSLEMVQFLLNWFKNHVLEKDVVIIRRLRQEGKI